MEQTATKPDLEAILRRFRGSQVAPSQAPHNPIEAEVHQASWRKLKSIAVKLGHKLTTTLEENRHLQQVLTQKERQIEELLREKERWSSSIKKVEREEPPSPPQVLKMALTCRQLEDEIHALTCEKAATWKQYRTLTEQYQLLKERELNLCEEREQLRQQLQKLQTSEVTLSETIATLKQQNAVLHQSLDEKTTREHEHQLQYRLLEERMAQEHEEKELSLRQVKEVEGILIFKLSTITELQEKVLELQQHVAAGRQENALLEETIHKLQDSLQKREESYRVLVSAHELAEKQLADSSSQICTLTAKTEHYEQLSQLMQQAMRHTSSLLQMLQNGLPANASVAELVKELSISPEDMPKQVEKLGLGISWNTI